MRKLIALVGALAGAVILVPAALGATAKTNPMQTTISTSAAPYMTQTGAGKPVAWKNPSGKRASLAMMCGRKNRPHITRNQSIGLASSTAVPGQASTPATRACTG